MHESTSPTSASSNAPPIVRAPRAPSVKTRAPSVKTRASSFKSLAAAALIAGSLLGGQSASAATATTTVEVTLPTVLVLYHYDTIQLEVAQAALSDFLTGGAAVACGGDSCQQVPDLDLRGTPITDLAAATVDGLLSDTNPALAGGVPTSTFTVQNAVGVRALGCATYTAAVAQNAASHASVTVDAAGSLTDIDGAACAVAMTVGDLLFDIDFSLVDATQIDAVFDITVTGNP